MTLVAVLRTGAGQGPPGPGVGDEVLYRAGEVEEAGRQAGGLTGRGEADEQINGC